MVSQYIVKDMRGSYTSYSYNGRTAAWTLCCSLANASLAQKIPHFLYKLSWPVLPGQADSGTIIDLRFHTNITQLFLKISFSTCSQHGCRQLRMRSRHNTSRIHTDTLAHGHFCPPQHNRHFRQPLGLGLKHTSSHTLATFCHRQ